MRIFLDDRRPAPDETWVLARHPDEVISMLESGQVSELSLDHDLSLFNDDGAEVDGYSVLTYIERAIALDEINFPLPKLRVHSGNPPAHERMQKAIDAIYRLAQRKGLMTPE